MRLIDADALLKELESRELQPTKDTEGFIDGWCEGFNTVVDMINNQSTAYDTEKVVAELEEMLELTRKAQTIECRINDGYGTPLQAKYSGEIGALLNAIEIVRRGGVE